MSVSSAFFNGPQQLPASLKNRNPNNSIKECRFLHFNSIAKLNEAAKSDLYFPLEDNGRTVS